MGRIHVACIASQDDYDNGNVKRMVASVRDFADQVFVISAPTNGGGFTGGSRWEQVKNNSIADTAIRVIAASVGAR